MIYSDLRRLKATLGDLRRLWATLGDLRSQSRPILQDKLHSFSIQDDRNTRFPSTTNINNIIKSFCIENSPLDETVQSGQSVIMKCAG